MVARGCPQIDNDANAVLLEALEELLTTGLKIKIALATMEQDALDFEAAVHKASAALEQARG